MPGGLSFPELTIGLPFNVWVLFSMSKWSANRKLRLLTDSECLGSKAEVLSSYEVQ
jgi:hypothetical protein